MVQLVPSDSARLSPWRGNNGASQGSSALLQSPQPHPLRLQALHTSIRRACPGSNTPGGAHHACRLCGLATLLGDHKRNTRRLQTALGGAPETCCSSIPIRWSCRWDVVLRVLMLTRYCRMGASSRLRAYQHVPYLETHGVE